MTVTAVPTADPEPAAAVLAVTHVVTLYVTLDETVAASLNVSHAVTLYVTLDETLAATLNVSHAVTLAVTLAGSDHSGQSLDTLPAQSWQQQQQVVALVALHTLAAGVVGPAFASPDC